MEERKFNVKLKRLASRKEYDHALTFGIPNVPLPDKLVFLSPILNQGQVPACTAYSVNAIRSSVTGKNYDPERFWQEELKVLGVKDAEGADLETPFAVARQTGFFLPNSDVPIDKISAYFWLRIKLGFDTFDAYRQTINQINRPLSAGILWYLDWDGQGIVPHTRQTILGPHDVKIAGFEKINGIDYLVIQNSFGTAYGDNGLFYFDRYMTNLCFTFGALYDSDDTDPQVQRLGLINAIMFNLVQLYKRLIELRFGDGVSKLDLWASAIKRFEGWYFLSHSWNTNNPGNLRYSPFIASLGAIRADARGFAVFATPMQGFNALKQFLTLCAKRQVIPYHKNNNGTEKPDLTLYDFFEIYAPGADQNSPRHYAEFVAQKIGVSPTTLIKDLI